MPRGPAFIVCAPAIAVGVAAWVALAAGHARAENRATVRGVYYKEPSTRVVQPMVELKKDLPGGLDVGVHGLVDVISSASIRAGVEEDAIFTEARKEAGLSLGWITGPARVGGFYRHSTEPDYLSRAAGLSFRRDVWERSGTVAATVATAWDSVRPAYRSNMPFSLRVYFGALAYTQALSPTWIAQIGYDAIFFDGYQANPYYNIPNYGHEKVPETRLRHAATARVAHYLPEPAVAVQLHYRFYFDQGPDYYAGGKRVDAWGIVGHTVEARVQKQLGAAVDLRASYRYHSQTGANFWCNVTAQPSCYGTSPPFATADEKLGPLATHMPEVKLFWRPAFLARVGILRWAAGGTFELSYGHYFQRTHYESARLLQTGYSLPL